MKPVILYITFLISILFTQEEQLSNYHISLSLHEELINDFFLNMGTIEGEGETAFVKYNWELIEPKIDIEEDTILFFSRIKLKVGQLKTHKDVKGWVSASYNQDTNKIELKIEEAKVILDFDLFGKKIVLTEIDIAHYFSKAFNLNGPQPMSEYIEFDLPSGEKRQIKVKTNQSFMEIKKDKILVKTALDFSQ
tara:strand:+ start:309 stop:887 length:579 start_codon:yes stop_codon:yes gene_type:complete